MPKSKDRKAATGVGFCCPHCSDSKFPCVNMERTMRAGRPEKRRASRRDHPESEGHGAFQGDGTL